MFLKQVTLQPRRQRPRDNESPSHRAIPSGCLHGALSTWPPHRVPWCDLRTELVSIHISSGYILVQCSKGLWATAPGLQIWVHMESFHSSRPFLKNHY